MSSSPCRPSLRILARACIALPVVAALAGPAVPAAAATLDGTYAHAIMADPAVSALLTQTPVPTISAGASGTVPMSLTQPNGTTAYSGASGDYFTVTAPPNTTITSSGMTCGASSTLVVAKGGQSATCTTSAPGAWGVSRTIYLAVSSGTPGGTYAGTMTYSNAAGTVLASSPVQVTVPVTAQMAQTSVPTVSAGSSGTAPMTLTQANGTTAVPYGAGDFITVTAPSNTTITGVPSCPGTVAITANGQSATCTATSAGGWPTALPVTLAVNSATAGGTYTGTMTLTTAAGTRLATSPVAVAVPLSYQITQTSVPTISAGSSGTAPMTVTQADGKTTANAATGDIIKVTAPPNTKITAITCGAGTSYVVAADGSYATCYSDAAGVWTYTSRPVSLSVNSGAPAGTYTGLMTDTNAAGTVLASSPVTIIVPGIHIVKTSNPPPPGPVTSGQVITYTLTLTNPGSSPITGANVTDNLTNVIANTSNPASIIASAGTATFTKPRLTWTGTVPANNVPVTITYQVTVN
jgi:large repetitive protein